MEGDDNTDVVKLEAAIHTISGGMGIAPPPRVASFRQKSFLPEAGFVGARFRTRVANTEDADGFP
jgi:hypothetical protein